MSVFDDYRARIQAFGDDVRDAKVQRARHYMSRKIADSPSNRIITIDSIEKSVLIINCDEFNEKKIYMSPGDSLVPGSLVLWENTHWLITSVDTDPTITCAGKMSRCNYLIKWLDGDGVVHQQWSIVEDGTKYLTGEKPASTMDVGAARIAVTMPRNPDTILLSRGKRFLIDDEGTDHPLAYEITKPNKLFGVYESVGTIRFIMTETNLTKFDNVDLMIADYYSNDSTAAWTNTPGEEEVWL